MSDPIEFPVLVRVGTTHVWASERTYRFLMALKETARRLQQEGSSEGPPSAEGVSTNPLPYVGTRA